jgi:hypothetical protein
MQVHVKRERERQSLPVLPAHDYEAQERLLTLSKRNTMSRYICNHAWANPGPARELPSPPLKTYFGTRPSWHGQLKRLSNCLSQCRS